jgi:hypothetical protein
MSDDEILTPGEIVQGLTPERKRSEAEATGQRDVTAIEANERSNAATANTLVASARKFTRALRWRGKVI